MAEITDYLKGLGEQVVRSEKEILVVRNPTVDSLLNTFEENLKYAPEIGMFDFFVDIFKEVKYSSKDVRQVSIELKKYEPLFGSIYKNSVGFFLSALVNSCTDDNLEIVTEHFNIEIPVLGYDNTKNLTIIGSSGVSTGLGMSNGVLTVQGNAGSDTGINLSGGKMIIQGSTGNNCGWFMRGGEIIVEGNTGKLLGHGSSGGIIRVGGEILSYSESCDAKIYHKGVQVWPR